MTMTRAPRACVRPGWVALASAAALLGTASVARAAPGFGSLSARAGGDWYTLGLESLDVRVTTEGATARTEITHVFRNHRNRQAEGIFRLTLPPGAAIVRLAMDVEGAMMEGELVERSRARAVYDEIVAARTDPALLEHVGDDRYELWMFPLPARGTKTVVITYEQLLPRRGPEATYRFALPRLGAGDVPIGRLRFELVADGARLRTIERRGYRPRADIAVRIPRPRGQAAPGDTREIASADALDEIAGERAAGERAGGEAVAYADVRVQRTASGHYFVAEVVAGDGVWRRAASAAPSAVAIAIDSSRSVGRRGLSRAVRVARAVLAKLPDGTGAALAIGDLRARACGAGVLSPALRAKLAACLHRLERGQPAGGSDLGALVAQAMDKASWLASATPGRVTALIVSDGTPTLGVRDADALAEIARRGAAAGIAVHAAAVGGQPDRTVLEAIASAGGGRLYAGPAAVTTRAGTAALLAQLAQPLWTDIAVNPSGDDELAALLDAESRRASSLAIIGPRNLAPGEPLIVLGRLTGDRADLRLTGRIAGERVSATIAVDTARGRPAARLDRFWAKAQIDAITRELATEAAAGGDSDDGDDVRGTPRARAIAMSLRHGVMSPHTSFLVLETAGDYQRRGIARDTSRRNARELGQLEGQRIAPRQLAAAVAGRQRVARGSAAGRVMRTRRVAAPRIRIGSAIVMGDLDKRMIRRHVKRYAPELRACYERELQRNPRLAGVVDAVWTIDSDGRVIAASAAGTENRALADCIVRSIRKWRFPAARSSGIVQVRYPFTFRRADGHRAGERALPASERIALLEDLGGAASIADLRDLIALYLAAGRTDAADAALERGLARLRARGEPASHALELFSEPARVRYGAAFRAAARARLAEPFPPNELTLAMFDSYLRDAPEAIPKIFRARPEDGDVPTLAYDRRLGRYEFFDFFDRSAMLARLASANRPDLARALITAWRADRVPARRLYDLLTHDERVARALPDEVFAALAAQWPMPRGGARDDGERDPRDDVVRAYVRAGIAAGAESTVAARLRARCSRIAFEVARDDDSPCPGWLRLASADPGLRAHLAPLLAGQLAAVRARRRGTPGAPELIRAEAELLWASGRRDAALRVLSELVELAPREPRARLAYGDALIALGREDAGCAAIRAAEAATRAAFPDSRCAD